ncbi:MAG: hypothetical protein ACREPY_04930 [Rhodanobacteraceae bacterium]
MTTQHWEFLKKSDTSLGQFYPLHYIVAGYGDMEAAHAAESAFRDAGTSRDDVRAMDGEFVAGQLESQDDESVVERAETSLVKFMGTEMGYLSEDKNHALNGGAFLFVYAPDDDSVAHARQVFEHHAPVYARRYLRIAIERIIENPNAL